MKWTPQDRLERQAARMRPQDRAALEEARARGEVVGVTLKKRRRPKGGGKLTTVQQVAVDGVARCILRGEGFEAQQLIFLDDSEIGFRTSDFTSRERARLMDLPDSFILPRSAKAVRELTGDGVVVGVYAHFAEHLLVPLALADEQPVRPRTMPRRVRKEPGESTANRPIKRETVKVEALVPPEARDRLGELAAAEGMSISGYILACIDRQLAEDGLPPLPRYAPKPRSKPRGGPRGGGRRKKNRHRRGTDRPGRRAGARARAADPRSPFRYPGGKAQAAPTILGVMGRAETLAEPFAGGASLGVRALLTGATDRVVLAERDDDVRAVWEVTSGRRDDDFRALLRMLREARPHPGWWEDFLARHAEAQAPYVLAARGLLGSRFRWGGLPGGGVRSEAHLREALRTGTMIARLRAIRAERDRLEVRADATELIREFSDDPRATFFVDPPYSLPGGPAARLYRHHDVDHDGLFADLGSVRGRVLATYNDCPQVRILADRHGFRIGQLPVRDGHRRHRQELLLTRGIGPPDG